VGGVSRPQQAFRVKGDFLAGDYCIRHSHPEASERGRCAFGKPHWLENSEELAKQLAGIAV